MKKRLVDILILGIGSLFFALAINLFAIPNKFGEGGVTGITIILYYIYGWAPGIVSFILNGLLLIIGYKILDRSTVVYTIIVVILISIFLQLTKGFHIASHEVMVNAIFGGLLMGTGIGLIVRVGGTTAGSVIVARMITKYLDWNISYALLFVDTLVVLSSYFVIGIQSVLLTIIMLYVGTKIMDFILEGLNPKKAVTIISQEYEKIATEVASNIGRGITIIHAHGHYTKEKKQILYIVINKQELSAVKKIVHRADKAAFITIHDVRDVFGEGFLELTQ